MGQTVAEYFTATSTTATSAFSGYPGSSHRAETDNDLGSPTKRWRDLYLSTASLHLESTAGETGSARQWKFGIDQDNGQTTGTSTGFFRIQEGSTDMFYLNHSGQTGLGLKDPRARLHAKGNAALNGLGTLSSSGATVTGTGTSFQFGYNKVNIGDTITASGQSRTVVSIASNSSLIVDSAFSPALSGASYTFQPAIVRFDNSSDAIKFLVTSTGNVGIGNTNPAALLSVGRTIISSGLERQ